VASKEASYTDFTSGLALSQAIILLYLSLIARTVLSVCTRKNKAKSSSFFTRNLMGIPTNEILLNVLST